MPQQPRYAYYSMSNLKVRKLSAHYMQDTDNPDYSFNIIFGRLNGIAAQVEEVTGALKEYVAPQPSQVRNESSYQFGNIYQTEMC
jgi:hypothetical protein